MERSFINRLINCGVDIERFRNARILITGATGLIGGALVEQLLELEEQRHLGIKLVLFVRNLQKLEEHLGINKAHPSIEKMSGSVEFPFAIPGEIDYVIHCASMTQSRAMVENPVEVINTNFCGTQNVLKLSNEKKVKSVIYLSSMEVYGFSEKEERLTEENIQYLNPLALRSSYPESKRMAENLCVAYASEYNVPVKIIRLAQTFGAGVKKDDTRVFAEFARCAMEKKDIVLLTDGASKRMYLDTTDAVTAILAVLLNGKSGEAYNAANKATYCSIYEMAKMVAEKVSHRVIQVRLAINDFQNKQFPPPHRLFLDVTKLEELGWKADVSLEEMYASMITRWETENK